MSEAQDIDGLSFEDEDLVGSSDQVSETTDSLTDTLLMIKPIHFKGNDQTAVNNYFQKNDVTIAKDAHKKALSEFEQMVTILREKGIKVLVILDNEDHDTPDSIFPNNWVSFHEDGTACIYPMYAENRRYERRSDIFEFLGLQGIKVSKRVDLSSWESNERYLEGTGSMVLDRTNRIIYAALSDRTHPEVLDEFKDNFGYKAITFCANQTVKGRRKPIYHTNVMMAMGDSFVVVCLDSIDDDAEKHDLILSFATTGKEVIAITEDQVRCFAGNMLQLKNKDNQKFMVMSQAALNSLHADQKEELLKYNDDIIACSLQTIEALGGGSARCMMAEVFGKP